MAKEKDLSRRDFLKTAGLVGTGSVIAATGGLAQAADTTSQNDSAGTMVPTRSFGKSGIKVSCLALGGMFDIPSNQLILKQALKYGVTYWDTADCYEGGNSEKGIGQFLKKYPETRKDIFLVTKSDSRDPNGMTKLLNQSLERMNTEYVDMYFIHGLDNISEINNETMAWAERAKAEGKIKLFGFSAHSNMEDSMLAAAKLGWIDGVMVTYNYRLMHKDSMKAAVDACAKAGVGLCAMKTQGGGPVLSDSEAELSMAGRFLKMGFTDKQAKLKAVWDNPNIASICSQMPNMTILMANIAAALNQAKLSADDRHFIEQYAMETASAYCAGCTNICQSAIDCDLPLGDIMRCLMYDRFYGESDRARTLFAEIPSSTRDRLLSVNYTAAEDRCPQGLKIGKLVEDAVKTLA